MKYLNEPLTSEKIIAVEKDFLMKSESYERSEKEKFAFLSFCLCDMLDAQYIFNPHDTDITKQLWMLAFNNVFTSDNFDYCMFPISFLMGNHNNKIISIMLNNTIQYKFPGVVVINLRNLRNSVTFWYIEGAGEFKPFRLKEKRYESEYCMFGENSIDISDTDLGRFLLRLDNIYGCPVELTEAVNVSECIFYDESLNIKFPGNDAEVRVRYFKHSPTELDKEYQKAIRDIRNSRTQERG